MLRGKTLESHLKTTHVRYWKKEGKKKLLLPWKLGIQAKENKILAGDAPGFGTSRHTAPFQTEKDVVPYR